MKKLRVGVIGLGMGRGHIKGYQMHPQAGVVAIADLSTDALKKVGDEFSIPGRYTDPQKMLDKEGLDVVSVVTPNKFHKPLTLAAFKAGCHVLCEKPMAMNAKEAREMLAASHRMRKRLMINFSYRFTEQAWALKKEVDQGILGDVYFGRTVWHRRRGVPKMGGWFGQKALAGGGPLIDLGVHRLDLALWLMGYPKPEWVMGGVYDPIASSIAKASGLKYDVEDLASAFIRFKNGATLVVEASWASNTKENETMETTLCGTRAGLTHRNIGGKYEYEAEIYMERNGAQYDMKLHPPVPAAKPSMYNLIDAIVNKTPHIATGEEGVLVMELLDAIYLSAASGKPVKIK